MKTYIFATVRGEDFIIQGNTPQEAYHNLCEREKDNGTLWRCNDYYRNRYAVKHEGFQQFEPDLSFTSPVYKEME